MSIHAPHSSPIAFEKEVRVAIVASEYNAVYVDVLLAQARQELQRLSSKIVVEIVRVPGAFEVPLLVKLLAERGGCDAIIALGLILRGETAHADLIAGAVSQSLLETSLAFSVPVIHEVLLVNTEEQAQVRCSDPSKNRGTEAAYAALAAIKAIHTIQSI